MVIRIPNYYIFQRYNFTDLCFQWIAASIQAISISSEIASHWLHLLKNAGYIVLSTRLPPKVWNDEQALQSSFA